MCLALLFICVLRMYILKLTKLTEVKILGILSLTPLSGLRIKPELFEEVAEADLQKLADAFGSAVDSAIDRIPVFSEKNVRLCPTANK